MSTQDATLTLRESDDSTSAPTLALVLLLVGHAVVDFLAALVPSSLGLLEVRVGMTAKQTAWLMGVGPLFSGLSQPLCALVSDRQHTRRWGVVGLVLAGLGICSLGLASRMAALVVFYMIGMIGIGMFHPVAATTIGHLGDHRRNSAVSLFFVTGMLGGVLGAACWPRFLATSFGFDSLPWVVGPVLVLAVLTARSFLQLPAPKTFHESAILQPIKPANWYSIAYLYLAACARFCVNLSLFYLYVRWTQITVAAEHTDWSPEQVADVAAPITGDLNAATLLGMAIGGLMAGKLVRVGREKRPMVWVPILFAPVIVLFPYLPSPFGYLLAVLAGVGFASMIPVGIAWAQRLLPHRANLASSLMMGGAWTVAMLGPPTAEYFVARWGLETAFLLTALGLVVSGLLCLPLQESNSRSDRLSADQPVDNSSV